MRCQVQLNLKVCKLDEIGNWRVWVLTLGLRFFLGSFFTMCFLVKMTGLPWYVTYRMFRWPLVTGHNIILRIPNFIFLIILWPLRYCQIRKKTHFDVRINLRFDFYGNSFKWTDCNLWFGMGFRMISDCRISGRYIGKREKGIILYQAICTWSKNRKNQ